ncbi:MAG: hypothetical protein N3D11_14695 [Candidatus Sumerlaeia bacterium]|nr:hypothetical protein [Candidatus Sumerlaeia bacterium]
MIPLFCQSKDVQRETSAAVGAGVRIIPTLGAAESFRAGRRVFLSKFDLTDIEFLGSIQSVAADAVTVAFATRESKGPGAKLWTPQSLFEWPVSLEPAVQRTQQTGVEVVRAIGGPAYATRLRQPQWVETVRFDDLTDERAAQLAEWFDQQAAGGLEQFSYVDAARVLWRVALDTPVLEWSRNARHLLSVGFRLQLIAQGEYV